MAGIEPGAVIAAARKRASLTQGQLGEQSGYAQTTISRIERGRQQARDVHVLRRLADALGLAYRDLGLAAEPNDEAWALEVLRRAEASDTGKDTLAGMHAVADSLCCEYPHVSAPVLHQRTRQHLDAALRLLDGRVTLAQHREVLVIAGWLALLAGCLEYDQKRDADAECTRQVAHSLGAQAGHAEIVGWAYEMAAWFALTKGHYRKVIAAAQAGLATTRKHGVAAQLYAQEAKARARLGDREAVTTALERGGALLESLPAPEHPEHHFVVDPSKQAFYAMDCYRIVGDDTRAAQRAREVLRLHTNPDGSERAPMRMAEARLTLATVTARGGDLTRAVEDAEAALNGDRRSLPSLMMTAGELASELRTRFPDEPASREYAERIRAMRHDSSVSP